MKKLYTVTFEAEVVVVAESEKEAMENAEDAIGDITFEPSRASELDVFPDGWDEDSLPYGHQDSENPDRTIGQWIDLGAGPKFIGRTNRKTP